MSGEPCFYCRRAAAGLDWIGHVDCAFLRFSEVPPHIFAMSRSKHLPNFLLADEPERLLRATGRQRDRLIFMLMLYMGLRVSETVKLDCSHLDLKRRILWCRRAKGDKDRCLPVPSILLGPLRSWVRSRKKGPVFPSPRGGMLTTRAVQLIVKRMAVKADLPDPLEPRKYHPHAFRHIAASRMLEPRGGYQRRQGNARAFQRGRNIPILAHHA